MTTPKRGRPERRAPSLPQIEEQPDALTGLEVKQTKVDEGEQDKGRRASTPALRNLVPKPKRAQKDIFRDVMEEQKYAKQIESENIKIIGAQLSVAGNKAFLAILKLAEESHIYDGLYDKDGNFSVGAPIIRATIRDYYKAYGLKSFVSERGWTESSRSERNDALSGLWELTHRHLSVWNENSKRNVTIGGLINDLTFENINQEAIIKQDLTVKSETPIDESSADKSREFIERAEYISFSPSRIVMSKSYALLQIVNIERVNHFLKNSTPPKRLTNRHYKLFYILTLKAKEDKSKNKVITTKIIYDDFLYNIGVDDHTRKKRCRKYAEAILDDYKKAGRIIKWEIKPDKEGWDTYVFIKYDKTLFLNCPSLPEAVDG